MAKFEIPKEKTKGKPRQTKAPATEQQSETCDDEKQQKYIDLEQEVKEAESRTNTKSAAGEVTDTSAEAVRQEAEASEAEGKTATDASAAQAAAADDESIEQRHAAALEGTAASEAQERNGKDERIRALVQERKTTEKHNNDRIFEISKEIKKYIRDNKRTKRQEKYKILEKVKGTKNTSSIKSVKKRILIPKVKNKEGEAVKTRQGIANVFAKFYEDLYKGEKDYNDEDTSSYTEPNNADPSQLDSIPEFTTEEIQAAIDRLKKGKAKDSNGIRAEQLKICSDDTKEKIRTIFNEIAQQEDFTPKSWRKIRIQVIYKKGDREDPVNYRPTCSLPVLYARLAPCLHKVQPPDQAGFRPNHRCEDHLSVQDSGATLSGVGVYRCTSVR